MLQKTCRMSDETARHHGAGVPDAKNQSACKGDQHCHPADACPERSNGPGMKSRPRQGSRNPTPASQILGHVSHPPATPYSLLKAAGRRFDFASS